MGEQEQHTIKCSEQMHLLFQIRRNVTQSAGREDVKAKNHTSWVPQPIVECLIPDYLTSCIAIIWVIQVMFASYQ